jgi:hypothetical protein
MRRTVVPFLLVGVALALSWGAFGCGNGTPSSVVTVTATPTSSQASGIPAGAIATVGSGVVTQGQFDGIIRQAEAQNSQAGKKPFPKVGSLAYKAYAAQVVNYLVTQELVDQAAEEMNVTVTDAQVKTRIAQLEKAYGGAAKTDETLKKQGMTRADLNQLMRDQLLDQAVYNKVVAGVATTKKQRAAWTKWLKGKTDAAHVKYASGYDPTELKKTVASPPASKSPSP